MKYITFEHTKKGTNKAMRFNAYKIATAQTKGARVSLAKYRKAYKIAEELASINRFADYVANFDNDPKRYTEEKSERLNNRLEARAQDLAKGLASFGLCFLNCSRFYSIAKRGDNSIIYLRG